MENKGASRNTKKIDARVKILEDKKKYDEKYVKL